MGLLSGYYEEPVPDVLTDQQVSEIVAHVRAQNESIRELSRQLSDHVGLSFDQAYWHFTSMPEDINQFLHSPIGWSVLAFCLARDFGLPEPSYQPIVH